MKRGEGGGERDMADYIVDSVQALSLRSASAGVMRILNMTYQDFKPSDWSNDKYFSLHETSCA